MRKKASCLLWQEIWIREIKWLKKAKGYIEVIKMDKQDKSPLSKTEYGIYFDCMNTPGSIAYNIPFFLKLGREVDADRLKRAIEAAIDNHSYIKLRLGIDDGGNVYKLLMDEPAQVEVRALHDAELDKKSLVQPFTLLGERLYRCCIFKLDSCIMLFLDIHHIIFDGFSAQVLLNDIDRAYNGLPPVAELCTGNDVSRAEAARLKTDEIHQAEEYYRSVFGGCELNSVMINDKNDGTPVAEAFCHEFSAFAAGDIRSFCRKMGIRTSTFFCGVYGLVLAKFSGGEESLFATVYNGRNEGLANTCGMFVKTLPVYCDFREDRSIAEFLQALDRQLADSRKYDLYSYADICADLQIKPATIFAYQGDMFRHVSFCGGEVFAEGMDVPDAKANITAELSRSNGRFSMRLEYRGDLYEKKSVEGFLSSFEQAVIDLMNKERINDVDITGRKQLALLDSFNHTGRDYEKTDVVTLFRRQVEKYADRAAVVYLDKSYTYKEVDEISEKIGAYIRSLGLGREDVVSVLVPRSEYIALVSLGILKAGAAYQPLDPSYPVERLSFMMKDAGAKLLIADRALLERVPDCQCRVFLTDEIASLPDCGKISLHPAPEDLFIMLYTSGSTGTPKGCMLEHRNIVSFCSWYRNYYSLTPQSRVAAYASYGFDANMMDMYPALTSGACVHIIDEAIRLDLLALKGYFNENGITHCFMTTQVGRQFAAEAGNTPLRELSVGGERLVPIAPPEKYRLINAYGPTECTIFTTVFEIDRLYDRVPVGRALDNVRLYVVDRQGRRVPPCVPGELWVAGCGVSRGYLNRPEQNERAFIRNPFTDEQGYERIYRTGDIVRYLPDGNIDFIGRNDGQVKIRGFRIELSEVEGIIREFPDIDDATVAAFDEPGGGKFIAAYIVSGKKISINELNDFILANKPPYMVPAVTMQIDKIPLNQNQKVNKRALPVPRKQAENSRPPENAVQQKIFDCISSVTGSGDFGITTDIFYAGVTSIGAIRLNVLLSEEFDTVVKINDLRENNTVLKLEKFLLRAEKIKAEKSGPYELREDYPVTQTQNGIFVECAANLNSTMYNIPYLFKLSSRVDTDRLKAAVENTINAHPYIKTRLFLNETGDIRAARNDGSRPVVEVIQCDALPAASELVLPYKMLDSSLYRARIYKTPSASYLFLDFHHIICDGTSEAVIVEDINSFYEGRAVEAEGYTGFEAALDEERARGTDAYDRAKAYYDAVFSGCDADCLPVRDRNEPVPSVGRCEVACDVPLESIRAYCAKNNITMNAFFNGAFGVMLAKFNYKDEALYTTIYNGRSDPRLSRAVTMLVKTLPVYCRTEGSRKITELLTDMKNQLMESMANDIYSFGEISRAYDIKVDIIFAYQGSSFDFDTMGGERAESRILGLDAAKSPISIDVLIREGRLVIACEYRADMYDESTLMGMAGCLSAIAREFLQKTYIKEISMLSLRSEEEMEGFNATDYPVSFVPVHELFENQVKIHGSDTAFIAAGRRLSYHELNAAANKIAHSLLEKGIGPEEAVGIILPRTTDVAAAEYGIMKAGGAFLPMLPDYPDDRIDYCLKDSGSRFVITTREIKESRGHLFENKPYTALTVEELLLHPEAENPGRRLPASSLAYIIYTSGSTGTPKGVMIEHRNLCNFVNANRLNYETANFVSHGRTALSVASISFDFSLMEIHIPLCNGMAVCMAGEEEIHNPLALFRLIMENKVDVMSGTPSFMASFVDLPQAGQALKGIRMYDLGAEAFPPSLYEKLHRVSPDAVIVNGYGPTEATISCISKVMDGKGAVTIGRPGANVRAYICDRDGNILPAGVRGELVICGDGVGRGYVNLPEKTAAVFITLKGRRAYRSGDLARYNREGEIEFFGRLDNQVKIRGFRVELDEIEAVMNDYPQISRSVVVVRENPKSGQFLCGYFTAPQQVDRNKLTEHMKRSLTYYMIPSVLIQLETLPLTPNGKINKKALPEPEFTMEERKYTAPVNELQRRLCGMFANAVGTDRVGIDENFFEIGGTSLSASKIAMRAMLENLPVAYGDIFDNPTVEMLERHILRQGHSPSGSGEKQAEAVLEGENKALFYNKAQFVDEVSYTGTGNVMLTGATGFLGIHVLREIISHTDAAVYCLVRRSGAMDIEQRLKNLLVYYFSDSMDELFGRRIYLIEGDITDMEAVSQLEKYDFATVINCAACVKHFTNDDTLERINVQGVENLVAFCRKAGRRLVQISTVSIAGINVGGRFPREKVLYENELFFGQDLSNKYIDTKFRAERAVLEAAANDGLDGRIIRVGNLMSRHSDGEFQINSITNGFMRNLRAYAAIGMFPVSQMDEIVEFSPIDCTAAAVRLLAGAGGRFTVYHACNGHKVEMGDVIEALNSCGIKIDVVREEEFTAALNKALGDERKNMLVSGLISYLSSDSGQSREYIGYNSSFTTKALYRLGFKWPITSGEYLRNAFEALDTLGYFAGGFE